MNFEEGPGGSENGVVSVGDFLGKENETTPSWFEKVRNQPLERSLDRHSFSWGLGG